VPFGPSAPEIIPSLIADGFYERAVTALREILAREPRDAQNWQRLVRMSRALGDLRGAHEACEKWADLEPGTPRAAYLSAILSGRNLPAEPLEPGCLPCPFVRIGNFLTEDDHGGLFELACRQREAVVPATVGEGVHRPDIRSSKLAPKTGCTEIMPWFLPRVRELLPEVLPRLVPQSIKVERIELRMTIHDDGDFYAVHRDTGKAATQTRRVTCVYYFHRQPAAFTGGDLLLYDTDFKNDVYSSAFTRIQPADNSIVFFPSACVHQVTPIHCASGDPRDGRFTLNGWFHEQAVQE
jgi:SM-20-related protein